MPYVAGMRRLWVLLLVGACALPASHLNAMLDEPRHGGEELAVVLIGVAFVFVVIPGLVNWRRS